MPWKIEIGDGTLPGYSVAWYQCGDIANVPQAWNTPRGAWQWLQSKLHGPWARGYRTRSLIMHADPKMRPYRLPR